MTKALGDRFGRKGALSLSSLVFGAGSGLSACGDSCAHATPRPTAVALGRS
jgi:MFS family permease